MKKMITLLAAVSFFVFGCDKSPKTLSGVFLLNNEKLSDGLSRAGGVNMGDLNIILDFRTDGTVRETWGDVGRGQGTYTIQGNTVSVSMQMHFSAPELSDQPDQTEHANYTIEGDDLLNEKGTRYIRQRQ